MSNTGLKFVIVALFLVLVLSLIIIFEDLTAEKQHLDFVPTYILKRVDVNTFHIISKDGELIRTTTTDSVSYYLENL